MQNYKNLYSVDENAVKQRLQSYLSGGFSSVEAGPQELNIKKIILSMLDLTTLEGADTDEKVRLLCQKAYAYNEKHPELPNVAAVCVYPTLVGIAAQALQGKNINIASVAGAFPSGLSPLKLRTEEVKYAVENGANEIDMVISRGKFLEDNFSYVFDEVAAHKEACGEAHLKVILETGELKTLSNIKIASRIAIDAGADFIKTSTGKINPAATPEAVLVMADVVKEYHEETGKIIGIKPAGGIADTQTAINYLKIIDNILGNTWIHKNNFRFGASRLADDVYLAITG